MLDLLVLNSLLNSHCTRTTCYDSHAKSCPLPSLDRFIHAFLPTTLNKMPCFDPCLVFFQTLYLQWFIFNKFSFLNGQLWDILYDAISCSNHINCQDSQIPNAKSQQHLTSSLCCLVFSKSSYIHVKKKL
jgi:hypothetical protein